MKARIHDVNGFLTKCVTLIQNLWFKTKWASLDFKTEKSD
jgi:hypothetical protein